MGPRELEDQKQDSNNPGPSANQVEEYIQVSMLNQVGSIPEHQSAVIMR